MARLRFQRARQNAIHRAGGNPPPCFAGPLPGGDYRRPHPLPGQPTPLLRRTPPRRGYHHRPHPLLGGVAEGRGGSGRSRLTTRFLACRRGAAALESAIACVVLIFALAGLYQIVQTVFVGDLIQRAAHRVARANALYDTAAGNPAQLRTRILEAIEAELGQLLSFELSENGTCEPEEEDDREADDEDAVPKDFCLAVKIDVYDCPLCLKDNKLSSRANAALGGDAGDIVVVRLHLVPRTVLGKIEQQLFGSGLRATAVMRNERLEEA